MVVPQSVLATEQQNVLTGELCVLLFNIELGYFQCSSATEERSNFSTVFYFILFLHIVIDRVEINCDK